MINPRRRTRARPGGAAADKSAKAMPPLWRYFSRQLQGPLPSRHTTEVGHRFVEHVGEVEVELNATSEAGIFEAALAALAELLDVESASEPVSHDIELVGSDRALLLVDWLSELVFLTETAGFVPERVASLELAEGHLRATVHGHRNHPRHLVKAVTLNKLAFEQEAGRWHGRVILDV
jgi:SHS2 domain-containing protein